MTNASVFALIWATIFVPAKILSMSLTSLEIVYTEFT